MKYKNFFYISLTAFVLVSCGSKEEPSQQTTFYKKENVSSKQLELSIEAS